MREIKFRGKRVDNGEWVYGYGAIDNEILHLDLYAGIVRIACIPETVGQYTGLKDKNSVEIYEGDICSDGIDLIQILWSDHHQWGCKILKGCVLSQGLIFPLWQWDNCKENAHRKLEAIGSIHDKGNPHERD